MRILIKFFMNYTKMYKLHYPLERSHNRSLVSITMDPKLRTCPQSQMKTITRSPSMNSD